MIGGGARSKPSTCCRLYSPTVQAWSNGVSASTLVRVRSSLDNGFDVVWTRQPRAGSAPCQSYGRRKPATFRERCCSGLPGGDLPARRGVQHLAAPASGEPFPSTAQQPRRRRTGRSRLHGGHRGRRLQDHYSASVRGTAPPGHALSMASLFDARPLVREQLTLASACGNAGRPNREMDTTVRRSLARFRHDRRRRAKTVRISDARNGRFTQLPAHKRQPTPNCCICQQYSGGLPPGQTASPPPEHRPFHASCPVDATLRTARSALRRHGPAAPDLKRAMFRCGAWISLCRAALRHPVSVGPGRALLRSRRLDGDDDAEGVVHALSSTPVLRYQARLGKGWATPHRC